MILLEQFLKNQTWLSYSWEFTSNFKGSGYDIEDFKEYSLWDNIKHINWKLSAKYDKEFVNVYKMDKDTIIDIYLDNNLNFKFFLPIYEKFKKNILYFKQKFDFKFRVFSFDSNNIILVGKNFFPDIKFSKKNNLDKIFDFYEFLNKNPKILVSDFLFLNKYDFPLNTYFWQLPINDIWSYFPVLNGYCSFCNDLWNEYNKKIEKLQTIGTFEKLPIE